MQQAARFAVVAALLAALAPGAGCGDDKLSKIGDDGGGGSGGSGGAGGAGGGGGIVDESLLLEGGGPVSVFAARIVELPLRLTRDGAPIAGSTVLFTLPAQAGGSALEAAPPTDADGRTSARLVAGASGLTFTVEASYEAARPALYEVTVDDHGTIQVSFSYEGLLTPASGLVGVYRTSQGCGLVTPTFQPAALASTETLPPGEESYLVQAGGSTVAALLLLDGAGEPAAFGCLEGLLVQAGETTAVTVVAHDL